VQELGHATDPGDPAVAQGMQVLDGLDHRCGVIGPDVGQPTDVAGPAYDDGRQRELLERQDSWIVIA